MGGVQTWDVVERSQLQLRVSPAGGVLGLDMGVALRMAEALGYRVADVARLLPWAESGLLTGVRSLGSG